MEWRQWQDLGGSFHPGSTPSLAGFVRRDVRFAAQMDDGRIVTSSRGLSGWTVPDDLAFTSADRPAIVEAPFGTVVAARGPDDALWIGGGQPWMSSGGDLASAPTIAHWWMDPNVEIFARAHDGTLAWFSLRNFGFATANPSPGSQRIIGIPCAVAAGPGLIHVFARRVGDAHLIYTAWDYRRWSAWTDLGEVAASNPCVVSRDIGRLEVFFAAPNGGLVRRAFVVETRGMLQEGEPRLVVAPQVLGDPSGFSFGPWHIEVFHRGSNGQPERVYGEGVREQEDASFSLGGRIMVGAPSFHGRARSVLACAARSARSELHFAISEDGYWGPWSNLGGFMDSDPVLVCTKGGGFHVVARDGVQQIALWSGFAKAPAGPRVLPHPSSGWCLGQPRAFVDDRDILHILTRTNFDILRDASVGSDGSFLGWTDLSGGPATRSPELVVVAAGALPAPFPGMTPAIAQPAGTSVLHPDASGTLMARHHDGQRWGGWSVFSTRATQAVARPFPVAGNSGFAYASGQVHPDQAIHAGWIGRAQDGWLYQQSMAWHEYVGRGARAVVLDSTPWTRSPTWVELADDLTGVQSLEPISETSGRTLVPVTHLFGRSPQGHVRWLATSSPEPMRQSWQWVARNFHIGGNVSACSQWSPFEDRPVLVAAAVELSGRMVVGHGGIGPSPERMQPRQTWIKAPRPPRPRPVRPPTVPAPTP